MSKFKITQAISVLAITFMLVGCHVETVVERHSRTRHASDFRPTIETVREFGGDEYTVARVETRDEYILRYGHRDINSPKRGIVDGRLGGRTREVETDFGKIYERPVNISDVGDGTVFHYQDDDEDNIYIDLVYFDDRSDIFLETGGDEYFTVPKGTVNYTGTNLFGVWESRSENGWGSGHSHGTFELTADFDAGTGSIEGETLMISAAGQDAGLDASEIEGEFGVNAETGTFSGDDLTVTNSATGEEYEALINGSFHGRNSTSVTGIYVEDSRNPSFFGAIAGVKD